MKVALVRPPNKGNEIRGIGFYADRLFKAISEISDLEISWMNYSQNPFAYQKYDIVHFPYYDVFYLSMPPVRVSRTIVTLHDAIPLKFPKAYPLGKKAKLILPVQTKLLKGVDAIITDSKASKNDIQETLKINPSKVFVTHLAADPAFKPIDDKQRLEKVKQKFKLPEQFVLYTGGINWNKNIVSLLKACTEMDVNLVLVGKEFLGQPTNHVEMLPLKDMQPYFISPKIKRLGFVETDALVGLYNLATVYVQPSVYEGFGLPVLESFACGTPVICGQGGSLAEIIGSAAIEADVENPKEIASKIAEVFSFSPSAREKIAEKGISQAAKFSWQKTAEETYAIYQEVL